MKHRRLLGAVALGVSATTVGTLGFAGTASASPADDVPVIVDNIPAAVDALIDGIQAAIDDATATTPPSAVALSEGLGDALVDAGSALVAGTEQFGALGLGFTLLNGAVQGALAPYLEAIDDPSTAGDLVNPDDVSTLLTNLGPAVDALLHGNGDDGVTCAAAETLRGNLSGGTGFGALNTPATLGCALTGLVGFAVTITENTNYVDLTTPLLVAALVGGIAGGDYVQQVEDAVGPGIASLGGVLEPIASVLDAL